MKLLESELNNQKTRRFKTVCFSNQIKRNGEKHDCCSTLELGSLKAVFSRNPIDVILSGVNTARIKSSQMNNAERVDPSISVYL